MLDLILKIFTVLNKIRYMVTKWLKVNGKLGTGRNVIAGEMEKLRGKESLYWN